MSPLTMIVAEHLLLRRDIRMLNVKMYAERLLSKTGQTDKPESD